MYTDHHDRGLISSSSSSTQPTPYRFKPLSDELRSKIILNGHGNLSITSHRLHPIKCVDPDDPTSWEHLTEVHPFPGLAHYFTPNKRPHTPGEEIDGSPVFELYYIEIKKIDPPRDFYSIYMTGTNTSHRAMIIYHLPEGEKITLNQPLPLKNIFRPPSALNSVTIALSNPSVHGWIFWHEPYSYPPHVEYGMRQVVDVKDNITDSVASISYQLIESAAVAELEFTFLNDEELPITILSGNIFATTDGDPYTKRIIRQFPSSVFLQSKEPLSVYRSVFGVPLGSCLNLHVDLKYVVVGRNKPYTMGGTLDFMVPNKTESVVRYITSHRHNSITEMRVKVSWWDRMV